MNSIVKSVLLALLVFLASFSVPVASADDDVATVFAGRWDCQLASPGGPIRFSLDLFDGANAANSGGQAWTGYFLNGDERIKIPKVTLVDNVLTLDIDHYDSRIEARYDKVKQVWFGQWKKRRGPNQSVDMKFYADRPKVEELAWGLLVDRKTGEHVDVTPIREAREPFLGKWVVRFNGSEDPAVAKFWSRASWALPIGATFLTTTGDYRYLNGEVIDGQLTVSCFDGAHAFLFKAKLQEDGTLLGDFWSSNTWHQRWTATRDKDAMLPDALKQTEWDDAVDWGRLSFPDLDGKPTRLDDSKFAGKARMVYLFGSWCPNCHDAAGYFSTLQKKYGPRGLSILGLAFELTGDFSRDSEQVKIYLKRHKANYPVLVAGLSDKEIASKELPFLDRVRSYPTTLFLDRDGKIRAVYTGFSGPATGDAHVELKTKFENLIEELLQE